MRGPLCVSRQPPEQFQAGGTELSSGQPNRPLGLDPGQHTTIREHPGDLISDSQNRPCHAHSQPRSPVSDHEPCRRGRHDPNLTEPGEVVDDATLMDHLTEALNVRNSISSNSRRLPVGGIGPQCAELRAGDAEVHCDDITLGDHGDEFLVVVRHRRPRTLDHLAYRVRVLLEVAHTGGSRRHSQLRTAHRSRRSGVRSTPRRTDAARRPCSLRYPSHLRSRASLLPSARRWQARRFLASPRWARHFVEQMALDEAPRW